MTIRVHDIRAFGRRVLVGTHIIDTLHKYFRDNKTFVKKGEEVVDPKAKGMLGKYQPKCVKSLDALVLNINQAKL